MKKDPLRGFLTILLLLSFLAGCSDSKPCNITVTGADVPMTQFAQEEIMAAGRR